MTAYPGARPPYNTEMPSVTSGVSFNGFEVYSWDTWFQVLTLDQLETLAVKWFHTIQRVKGHEHRVMVWNQQQLWKEIFNRKSPA